MRYDVGKTDRLSVMRAQNASDFRPFRRLFLAKYGVGSGYVALRAPYAYAIALLPVGQYGLFFALLPVGQYGLFFALLPVGQYGLLALAMAIAHTPAHFVCLERFDHELRDEFCIFDGVG